MYNSRINKHGKGSIISQCNSTTLWGGGADGERDFTTTQGLLLLLLLLQGLHYYKKEAFVSLPTSDQNTLGVKKNLSQTLDNCLCYYCIKKSTQCHNFPSKNIAKKI